MSRHDADLVAFFFGICFLVSAGLAITVRTGDLGFGNAGANGAWIAGVLLAAVGTIGVVGSISSRRRGSPPDPATEPAVDDSTEDILDDDLPAVEAPEETSTPDLDPDQASR